MGESGSKAGKKMSSKSFTHVNGHIDKAETASKRSSSTSEEPKDATSPVPVRSYQDSSDIIFTVRDPPPYTRQTVIVQKNSDIILLKTTTTKSVTGAILPSRSEGLQIIKGNPASGSSLNEEVDGPELYDDVNVSSTSSLNINRALRQPSSVPLGVDEDMDLTNLSTITYLSPGNDTHQQANNYFGKTKEESSKLSRLVASKINTVYNDIGERISKLHNWVVDATGVRETTEYKITVNIVSAIAKKAASSLNLASSYLNPDGAIAVAINKAAEKVDETFDSLKAKFNSANEMEPDNNTQQQENTYFGETKEDSLKLSQMVVSKMNTICNAIGKRISIIHSKIAHAIGVGEKAEYKITANIIFALTRIAVSALKLAASYLDTTTGGVITSAIVKGTEKVDDTFESIKTTFNCAEQMFREM